MGGSVTQAPTTSPPPSGTNQYTNHAPTSHHPLPLSSTNQHTYQPRTNLSRTPPSSIPPRHQPTPTAPLTIHPHLAGPTRKRKVTIWIVDTTRYVAGPTAQRQERRGPSSVPSYLGRKTNRQRRAGRATPRSTTGHRAIHQSIHRAQQQAKPASHGGSQPSSQAAKHQRPGQPFRSLPATATATATPIATRPHPLAQDTSLLAPTSNASDKPSKPSAAKRIAAQHQKAESTRKHAKARHQDAPRQAFRRAKFCFFAFLLFFPVPHVRTCASASAG